MLHVFRSYLPANTGIDPMQVLCRARFEEDGPYTSIGVLEACLYLFFAKGDAVARWYYCIQHWPYL